MPLIPSGRVDFDSVLTNMYGCSPCPKCSQELRASYKDGKGGHIIKCDNCLFVEPVENPEIFEEDEE